VRFIKDCKDLTIECHECGKVGTKRNTIQFNNLCQHYLHLCNRCLKRLKIIIEKEAADEQA